MSNKLIVALFALIAVLMVAVVILLATLVKQNNRQTLQGMIGASPQVIETNQAELNAMLTGTANGLIANYASSQTASFSATRTMDMGTLYAVRTHVYGDLSSTP